MQNAQTKEISLNIGKIFGYALIFWRIYRCNFVNYCRIDIRGNKNTNNANSALFYRGPNWLLPSMIHFCFRETKQVKRQ